MIRRVSCSEVKELLRLVTWLARMTLVQAVLPIHHHVVADIVDVRSVSSIGDDVDILESPVKARGGFAAVDLDQALAIGVASKVLEVNVGPLKGTRVWVKTALGSSVGETEVIRSGVCRHSSGPTLFRL